MLSLIDVFRRCTLRARKLRLSANEKSVLYALMYIWNSEGRKDTIKIELRTVHELADIPPTSFTRALQKINTSRVGFHLKLSNGKRVGTLWLSEGDLVESSGAFQNPRARQSKEAEKKEEKIGCADFSSFDSAEVKERTPNETVDRTRSSGKTESDKQKTATETVHGAGAESNRNDRHIDELQSSLSLLERFGGYFPR